MTPKEAWSGENFMLDIPKSSYVWLMCMWQIIIELIKLDERSTTCALLGVIEEFKAYHSIIPLIER